MRAMTMAANATTTTATGTAYAAGLRRLLERADGERLGASTGSTPVKIALMEGS